MTVRTEHRERVAVLTLDAPPANAMDAASLDELSAAVGDATAADDVAAIVITAAGKAFSAGLDLKAIQRADTDAQEVLIEALNRCFLSVYSCPKFVVGAINGHAIAGGLVLALCCDVRLVTDAPLRAGLAEVSVGVVYPVGALEVVRGELAGAPLRRLVLRGDLVDADEGVA
ncbi:MAG: enoyl-CoA hydratase/isomerase family protein, partial [Acidimicrobiia bacterium]|nr:enoyl-CoA hydratase/isomerase family protein [Acidimicrobiia bacterium]